MKEETILAHIKKDFEHLPVLESLLQYTSMLLHFYAGHRQTSATKWVAFLEKYKDISTDAIRPHLILFTGHGMHEYRPCLDYEGDITDDDEEIGTIIEHPEIDIDISFANEDEEDMYNEASWEINRRVALTWLASIWQEIKGDQYGVIVKTLENSGIREFYFNDMADGDQSVYFLDFSPLTIPKQHFEMPLSIGEIYERVKASHS